MHDTTQQDIHEFLGKLINTTEIGNHLNDLFTIKYEITVTCSKHGYKSTKTDEETNVQLQINDGDIRTDFQKFCCAPIYG